MSDQPAGHSAGSRTQRPHHPDGWNVPRDESTGTKALPRGVDGQSLGGRGR